MLLRGRITLAVLVALCLGATYAILRSCGEREVRAVPLAKGKSKPVPATAKWAYTGRYPLARFLVCYVNYEPGTQLDPLRREFIRYMFSKKGQEDVIKDGYFPISARIAMQELAKVNLAPQPKS